MTGENRTQGRKVIVIGLACLVLSFALAAVAMSYVTALNDKNAEIAQLQTNLDENSAEIEALKQQLNSLNNSDVANLTKRLAEKDTQIANLTSQIVALNSQIRLLQTQIAQNQPSELSLQEKIRDAMMDYIKFNHPETAQFMKDLNWTGGRTTPATLIGAETYYYVSLGWKFTLNYPVVPNPIYNATADYSNPYTGIPYRIIWTGTWQNWSIKESSYVFAQ